MMSEVSNFSKINFIHFGYSAWSIKSELYNDGPKRDCMQGVGLHKDFLALEQNKSSSSTN